MCIYLKRIPAKSHPDPIWKDGDLGFFEEVAPMQQQLQQEEEQDE